MSHLKSPKEWAEWTKLQGNRSWVDFIREVQANAVEFAATQAIQYEEAINVADLNLLATEIRRGKIL